MEGVNSAELRRRNRILLLYLISLQYLHHSKRSCSRVAMPLKIIIVGAGIAGLCAAVALRQAGHLVEVGDAEKRR